MPPVLAADTLAKVDTFKAKIPTATTDLQICLPLRTMRLTSSFGWRVHPVTGSADFHRGIDLSARSEPVYSVVDGQVSATGYDPLLGNFIRIDHSDVQTIYGHLSVILVSRGQEVAAGQVVGITGRSGRTTGEHLHFSIKFRGSYIHPLDFLSQAAGTPLLQ
ncbi:M23 family metallopeptidase [Mucilaginibacter pineti]|nr:M23 family metallopeptidase [Mucilaginibacter pineti]